MDGTTWARWPDLELSKGFPLVASVYILIWQKFKTESPWLAKGPTEWQTYNQYEANIIKCLPYAGTVYESCLFIFCISAVLISGVYADSGERLLRNYAAHFLVNS